MGHDANGKLNGLILSYYMEHGHTLGDGPGGDLFYFMDNGMI